MFRVVGYIGGEGFLHQVPALPQPLLARLTVQVANSQNPQHL